MKVHSFEAPRSEVDGEAPLAGVTGDINCLEQTGHILEILSYRMINL